MRSDCCARAISGDDSTIAPIVPMNARRLIRSPRRRGRAASPVSRVARAPLLRLSRRIRVASSLDDLIGDGHQGRRYLEAQRFGRLEIDHQLELRRLQYRQIGRLGALQDLRRIYAGLTVLISEVRPVAHQAARG